MSEQEEFFRDRIIKEMKTRKTELVGKREKLEGMGYANGEISRLSERIDEIEKDIAYETQQLNFPPGRVRILSEFGYIFTPIRLDVKTNKYHRKIVDSGAINIWGFMLQNKKGALKWEIQEALWKPDSWATSRWLDQGLAYLSERKTYIERMAKVGGWNYLADKNILNEEFNIKGTVAPPLVINKSLYELKYKFLRGRFKEGAKVIVEALKNYSDVDMLTKYEKEDIIKKYSPLKYEIHLPYEGSITVDNPKGSLGNIYYSQSGDIDEYKSISEDEVLEIINKQGDKKVEEMLDLREKAHKHLGL